MRAPIRSTTSLARLASFSMRIRTGWPSRALEDLELLKAMAGRPAGQRELQLTRANGDCGVDR
jgi:hypothetical protein